MAWVRKHAHTGRRRLMDQLLSKVALIASKYLDSLKHEPVYPSSEALARLSQLDGALPAIGTDRERVIELLAAVGSPATVKSAGGRYFGYVIGGSLPAALAANWLAGTWDQNPFAVSASPLAAKVEEVALRWLIEALHLPADCG